MKDAYIILVVVVGIFFAWLIIAPKDPERLDDPYIRGGNETEGALETYNEQPRWIQEVGQGIEESRGR